MTWFHVFLIALTVLADASVLAMLRLPSRSIDIAPKLGDPLPPAPVVTTEWRGLVG